MFKLESYAFICLLLFSWVGAQETSSPDIQVIPIYEGQLAFIEALQAEPDLSLIEKTERYQELALAPYFEKCGDDRETFVQSNSGYEITSLEAWKDAIQELAAADIAGAIEEALTKAAPLLPADPITFCIFAIHPGDSFAIERMGGVRGFAGLGKIIYLRAYPVEGWLERLRYTATHEYHHAVWQQRFPNGYDDFQLTDYLIFEGRADNFAKMLYPDPPAPWTEALTPAEEREQWEAVQPHLKRPDLDFQRQVMFGNDNYLLWTGYTIGFNIVQAFLEKHPDMSVEAWIELDAQELLERSDYAP